MIDVKKIHRKKRWTGIELGQLELENFAVNYKNSIEGNASAPDLVEHQQLVDMADSLVSDDYLRDYNGYISIHEWISIKVNIASAQKQAALLHINKITNFITQALIAEDLYEYMRQQPLVLSQQEYDKLIAENKLNDHPKERKEIAILTQDRDHSVDTLRHHLEENIKSIVKAGSLENFFCDNSASIDLRIVEASKLQLANSYYYLLGYDEQINLIKAYYDISDRLDVFKHDTPDLTQRIKDLIEVVQHLYAKLKKADYVDKEFQNRKLETLKEVFWMPLKRISEYSVPEPHIEASKILLDKFAAFNAYRDYFDKLLCIRRDSEEV